MRLAAVLSMLRLASEASGQILKPPDDLDVGCWGARNRTAAVSSAASSRPDAVCLTPWRPLASDQPGEFDRKRCSASFQLARAITVIKIMDDTGMCPKRASTAGLTKSKLIQPQSSAMGNDRNSANPSP